MPRVNIKIVWGFVFMLIALSCQVTDMAIKRVGVRVCVQVWVCMHVC